MPKTITVEIPLAGIAKGETRTKITTSGFSGAACQDATKTLLERLGPVISDEPTQEAYDPIQVHETESQGG